MTKIKCSECNMVFSDTARLVRHVKKAHPDKPKYVHPNEYWQDPGGGI